MTDWNGSTKCTYNALGQATKVTDSNNQVVKYSWTKNGKKQSMTYPDGKVVQYAYDVVGNLVKVTDTKTGVTTYNYDNKNRLTTKNLPNGSESDYTYDSIGQLTERQEKTGSTTNGSYTYQYDANGNRTKETKVKAGGTETSTYAYDDLDQLMQTTDKKGTTTYTYDEFNNRKGKEESGKDKITYKYNNLNELVKDTKGMDTKSYSYDAKGNLSTRKVNGITKATYTFDSTNMLTDVKNTDENTESKYGYDGAGNRIKKTVSKNNKVVSKKSYVIDIMSSYQNIIAEGDTLSGDETDFTYGLGLVSVETGKGISYYRIDEKNSVEEIQNSSGVVKTEIEYDEFGNVENPDDIGTNGNIFSYTGHVYEEASLIYVKARYYDSETGRFISEDSDLGDIEELVTRNLYVYCKENPLMYYDLDGHSTSVPTLVNDGGSSKKNNGGSSKEKGTGKTIIIPDKVTGEVNGKSKTLYPTVNWGVIGGGGYPAGVQKDSKGRYKVAVGPGIINPNYSNNGKLWASDITSSNKYISVNLEDKKTNKLKTIQCVVVDLKAHTFNKYPAGQKYDTGDKAYFNVKNGIIQTGIAYPKSYNATKSEAFAKNNIDGTVIEFAGHKVDFDIKKYKLVSININ